MNRAFGYLRISKDRHGDSTSPDRQRAEIERAAAAKGFEVVDWFEDRDRSAYDRRARRPLFEAMLQRVPEVQAIFVWEVSRLARRTVVGAGLLDTLEEHDVRLISVTQGDSSEMSRLYLEMMFAFAAEESRIKGQRVRSAKRHLVAAGKVPYRARAFGWKRDELTGEVVHVPAEVAIIRQIAEDFLGGRGPALIADRLNRRGIQTVRGNAWSPTAVLDVLRSWRLAGFLAVDGKPTTAEPVLEPILDPDTWAAVQAQLRRRPRQGLRTPRTDAELSGLVICGECGSRMYVATLKGRGVYICRKRGSYATVISKRWLEAEMARALLERIDRSALAAEEAQVDQEADDADSDLRRTLARLQWGREELFRDFYQERSIDRDAFEQQRSELEERISNLTDKLQDAHDEQALLRRMAGYQDVADLWPQMTALERRAVFLSCLESVKVGRAAFKGAFPGPERLTVAWKLP